MADPKRMNTVLPSFIFRPFLSIQTFTSLLQFSRFLILFSPSSLLDAFKTIFQRVVICKTIDVREGGTISCTVNAYAEYRNGTQRLPCGTENCRSLPDKYLSSTNMQDLGLRYVLNQLNAASSYSKLWSEYIKEYLVINHVKCCIHVYHTHSNKLLVSQNTRDCH